MKNLEPVWLGLSIDLETKLSQLQKWHWLPVIKRALDGRKLCAQISLLIYLLSLMFVVSMCSSTDLVGMQLNDLGTPKQNTDYVLVTHVAVAVLLSCDSPLFAVRN